MTLCELNKQAALLSYEAPPSVSVTDVNNAITEKTPFYGLVGGAGIGALGGAGLAKILQLEEQDAKRAVLGGMTLGALPASVVGIKRGLSSYGLGGYGNAAGLYTGGLGGLLSGAGLGGIGGGTLGAGIGAMHSKFTGSDLGQATGMGAAIGAGLGMFGGGLSGLNMANDSIIAKLLRRR